jgi:ferredoxin-NADP reductase
MITLKLHHTKDESLLVRTFYFSPAQPVSYQAGQFAEFNLPHSNPDSKGISREFTLSSSPSENLLAITVKNSGTPSTFKEALWQLQPGEQLGINEPLGDFVLPLDDSIPLVWIAGGIGITPFRSHAVWLDDNQESRPITLIHYNHAEPIFFDLIQRHIGAANAHVVTEPSWQQQHNNPANIASAATAAALAKISPQTAQQAFFYIAGPDSMVQAVAQSLQGYHIARERIITDAFLGYK